MRRAKPLVSVIIPCYRSGAFLENTVQGILRVFSPACPYDLQLILVDDCSPDDTGAVIRRLAAADKRILGIGLAKNAGQAGARTAAYPFIRGNFAVFMDDDGQHPADLIPSLIRKAEEGYHLVYASFPILKESRARRAASAVNNLFMTILLRKPLSLRITSFFALDEKAVRAIRTRPRSALFIGGYLLPRTKHVCTVPAGQLARQEGKSGYTLRKLLRHWRALVRCRFWRGPETPAAEIAWTTDADASVQAR